MAEYGCCHIIWMDAGCLWRLSSSIQKAAIMVFLQLQVDFYGFLNLYYMKITLNGSWKHFTIPSTLFLLLFKCLLYIDFVFTLLPDLCLPDSGPVHMNTGIVKTAAFLMQFGRSSTHKHNIWSLKPDFFENSCQGEDF